jgi:hypothetical protein
MKKLIGIALISPICILLLGVCIIIVEILISAFAHDWQMPIQLLIITAVIMFLAWLGGKGLDLLGIGNKTIPELFKKTKSWEDVQRTFVFESAIKELDDVIIHINGKAYNSAIILIKAIKKDLSKFSKKTEQTIDQKAKKLGERYVGCKNAIRCSTPLQECPLNLSCKDYWPTN